MPTSAGTTHCVPPLIPVHLSPLPASVEPQAIHVVGANEHDAWYPKKNQDLTKYDSGPTGSVH